MKKKEKLKGKTGKVIIIFIKEKNKEGYRWIKRKGHLRIFRRKQECMKL